MNAHALAAVDSWLNDFSSDEASNRSQVSEEEARETIENDPELVDSALDLYFDADVLALDGKMLVIDYTTALKGAAVMLRTIKRHVLPAHMSAYDALMVQVIEAEGRMKSAIDEAVAREIGA